MILYRPVGQQELELIYDGGMKSFPARLPQQPIFYPVLQLEYARQISSDWNAKNGQLAGYVTQFKVEDSYLSQFEEHTVGGSQHQEFWIPAEEVEEFNRHITGHIKVVEAHFGDAFQGFIPDKFALQGKNAVEQFTLLANSYIYNRMDFFLEIKRNHKAIFLNYPFWLTYDFKNPGLKEKIVKAIKDAWFTSFPKTPLPVPPPVQEDTPFVNQVDADPLEDDSEEDVASEEQTYPVSFENPVHKEPAPAKKTYSISLGKPANEGTRPAKQTNLPSWVHRVQEDATPARQAASHFSKGLGLGISGRYQEAIEELSRAVEKNPDHVIARTSLGVAFHRLGEEDRALSCYEAALKIDPKNAEAHYFRADVLYSQGNVREAIAEYTTAIRLKPELIDAHQAPSPQDRLADYNPAPNDMHWISGPAHRILDLNQALETNPRQADLFKARAAEYSRLGNFEQAIADYNSSLKLQPEEASTLYSRGVAYEQFGQYERAREDYQRAAALNPLLAEEYIQRGVMFGQMGNLRQSIASLTEGIRLNPQNADAYFNRGTAYFQQGDLASAVNDFSNVIRLSPEDEAAYYWRGISNEEAGRHKEAIADYQQFLAISQDPQAREDVKQKLTQWNVSKPRKVRDRSAILDEQPKSNQIDSEKTNQSLDLHGLLIALGERALDSTWVGSDVNCYGESAEELLSLTEQDQPIDGQDFLRITSGIQQTIEGDFVAFDPDATSHWFFLRAWNGSGFYIEINDPKSRQRLRTQFPSMEEVEGASPPFMSLFIPI